MCECVCGCLKEIHTEIKDIGHGIIESRSEKTLDRLCKRKTFHLKLFFSIDAYDQTFIS